MANTKIYAIMQWICRGICSKKHEIVYAISMHHPSVLAFQETKLAKYNSFNTPGYTAIRKDGHFNCTSHGEVSIYVHKFTPCNEIVL